jgi:hypothetical protein
VISSQLGFAETPVYTLKEKRKTIAWLRLLFFVNSPEPSQPHFFLQLIFKTKKRERWIVVLFVFIYGFFLSKSRPTIAIAMIITIMTAAIPSVRSDAVATFDVDVAVGAGVAAAFCTIMVVSAFDGQ